MSEYVGVSGVWKAIAQQYVGVSGVWKTVTQEWVGVGGVWKLAWAGVNLQGLDAYGAAISPADALATYQLTSGGLEIADSAGSGTWLTSGAASDYDVRATLNSGSLSSGTTGSWLNLGTTRSWSVTRTSNITGSNVADLTIEIRLASSGAVLATASVTITAEVV